MTHTKDKLSMINWYFSQNWLGDESKKSEQNWSYNVYYWYSFFPIKNIKSLVKTVNKDWYRTETV